MAIASASSTFTPLILDRLVADRHDADTWSYLVLAACEGPAELAAVLDGGKTPAPRALTPSKPEAATEPPGAYLSAITVEGFRGIATRATLNLPPGPGLTLVVGRNGSGKSSFAEALEMLLTGDNRRWKDRSIVWKDGWRCLHHPHPCAIQAEFHVEGRGPVTVARQWADDAALEDSEAWFQEKSKARRPYAELGWQAVSEIHRPLLPYSELGTVFDNPSDIHDALAQVLGLGELDDILKVLQNEKKARQSRVDSATSRLDSLLPRLQAIVTATGDARAERCVTALKGKKKALDAVAEVLDNDSETPADPAVALLRHVHIQAPSRDQVEETARGLVEAVTAVEQSASTDAGRARSLAMLLEQALQFHASHGEDECPVCHAPGRLGPTWRDQTTNELTQLRTGANAAEQAHTRLDQVLKTARRMLEVPRANIQPLETMGLTFVTPALSAVDRWNSGASLTDARALAEHLTSHLDTLLAGLAALDAEVHTELARREDLWRPLANELRAWLPDGRVAENAQANVADLKKAESWFKTVQTDVRDQRFQPIADQAIALWRQLRQQSNVELGGVHLQGAATRRSVSLEVTVDGVPGAALGVMSQGELNALALSLFMPRASLPESPFRFMVIDDPVQSMDPSRVDGLAHALHEAARTRQVVVFTHDDRLPEAVRHLLIPATMIEVTRRPNSVVETRELKSPIMRYFDDAMAIVRTENLAEDVRRRLVPSFCRSGVEAACVAAVRRRRLKAGDPHGDIEVVLDDADSLRKRLALALFDDMSKAGEVGKSLAKRWSGSDAVARALNEGAHGDYDGGLETLTRDAELLAKRLGALQ